jgi:hypothetical protein
VTRRAGFGVAAALLCAVACPRHATAQLYPALPQRYLLTTDAFDNRAVWVNPAGLARRVEASLAADLTVERAPSAIRLSQYGASLRSRNAAFAWSHDRYPGGSGANNFALGAGLGDESLSLGVSRLWYGGPRGDQAWDVAVRARLIPLVALSLVWRNAGSPTVRDTIYRASIIPAAALYLLQGHLVAAMEGELSGDLHSLQEIRAGATCVIAAGVAISVRGEFSPGFVRRGFAVGVTLNAAQTRSTLAMLLPGTANSIQTVGVTSALVAAEPVSRRR